MACPCNCNWEDLVSLHKDGIVLMKGGLCQLIVDTSNNTVCGQPLQLHPRKPQRALELLADKRFQLFDPEIETTASSTTSQKSQIRTIYLHKCLFCDGTDNLTVAHIISHNTNENYSAFGPPTYDSPLDLYSPRNKLLLCGSKTVSGTCHNLFDYHNVALLYNSLDSKYYVVRVVPHLLDRITYNAEGSKELSFLSSLPKNQQPYKRLIAWRLRRCGFKNATVLGDRKLIDFVNAADLSECEERKDSSSVDESIITSEISAQDDK